MTHHYRLYGLHLASAIAIEGLRPATPAAQPDITVQIGAVAEALPGAKQGVLYQVQERAFLLSVPGVARYHVAEGRAITIDAAPSADDASVRLFLLGSALGALLHQRGMLPMHASAIAYEGSAVLFTGHSGIGKSTTAAAFTRLGHPLLADDITVIYAGAEGRPIAAPAFPQMKLWANTLAMLNQGADGLARVRPALEKFSVSADERFHDGALPVRHIFILGQHNQGEVEVKPMHGMGKLRALRQQVYRRRLMEEMGAETVHFPALTALARFTRLSTVRRPNHGNTLPTLLERLESDLRA